MPNALQTTQVGNGPLGSTSTSASISGASQTITFTQASTTVLLINGSTAILNFTLGATATTSNAFINAGQGFTYCGPPILSITILGTAASGSYSIFAY